MPEQPDNEALWRALLTGEMEVMRKNRRLYRRIPSAPRCKACNIPFRGIGGPFIGPQHPAVAVRAARDLLVAAPEVEPGEKLPSVSASIPAPPWSDRSVR